MKNNPLVSLSVITYNREKMLEKALCSLINQTYKNLEIIVCDNCSQDGTKALCEKYAEKDNRIKYYRHTENLGMTGNSNFAHVHSNGEYYAIINDDDWIDENYVEESLKQFEKHPDYVFISPTTVLYDQNYRMVYPTPCAKFENANVSKRVEEYILSNANSGMIIMGLIKTSVMKQLIEKEGTALQDRFAEDWVLMIKYLVAGKAKMINSTHLNKLHFGSTCNLESMKTIWKDLNGINYDNLMDKVGEYIAKSILNDEFYSIYLTEKQKKYLANTTTKSMEKAQKFCLYKFLFETYMTRRKFKTILKILFT